MELLRDKDGGKEAIHTANLRHRLEELVIVKTEAMSFSEIFDLPLVFLC